MPQSKQRITDDANKGEVPDNSGKAPGLKQVIGSVLAAAFGVQSKQNRERDFQHGKPVVYIVTGIVFTLLFIATVIGVVNAVLSSAG